MYRTTNRQQLEFADFYLPFSGHLNPQNRWIAMAEVVPWELVEEIYHAELIANVGQPIVSARTAFAALTIQERLGLTDRETVEAIQENPYLQFFIGLEEFTKDRPFDASLMVDFRKRFGEEGLARISEAVALAAIAKQETPEETNDNEPPTANAQESETQEAPTDGTEGEQEPPTNRGKLIVDATCAPADIRFPTDVSTLNEARVKMEEVIDALHAPLIGKQPRPRTYRKLARRAFVAFTKKKKPSRKAIRKAKRQQLGYVYRNLAAIDRLLAEHSMPHPLKLLSKRLYKNLLVCREVYRQQLEMLEQSTNRVADRIVSISQPHIRPIQRGKAGRPTEFGAKLSLSVIDGFSFVHRLSWDNYNEGGDLEGQIESYREQNGCYPESVHADKIYRTQANRRFCKQQNIRMSGPPLGRPPKHISAEEKKQARADEGIRNHVEGKFGQAKRRFGLARIMAKLASTSAAQISLTFLVMNLELALKQLFFALVFLCQRLARPVYSIQPAKRHSPPIQSPQKTNSHPPLPLVKFTYA